MTTLITNRPMNYQMVFNKMRTDLITVRKDEVFDNELDELNKLHLYWNGLVKVSLHWRTIANENLKSFIDKDKINRYLKNKLIEECRKIIRRISKIKCEQHSFLIKQRNLLEELKDRCVYIKLFF